MAGVVRRRHKALEGERFREEKVYTNSGLEQRNTEESCLRCASLNSMTNGQLQPISNPLFVFPFTPSPRLFEKAEAAHEELGERLPVLHRAKTAGFVRRGLAELSQGYECLDASRPWLVYWLLHSLELLEETITEEEKDDIVAFLSLCQVNSQSKTLNHPPCMQDPCGGFAGGPGQLAHLAPTYAAVNALCILGKVSTSTCTWNTWSI